MRASPAGRRPAKPVGMSSPGLTGRPNRRGFLIGAIFRKSATPRILRRPLKAGDDNRRAPSWRSRHSGTVCLLSGLTPRAPLAAGVVAHDQRPLVQERGRSIACRSAPTWMPTATAIGDFQGLMRRLDYLHGLGVTAIWLMPFQTSPCRDDGYDVSDYYSVDPRYGTLGDFVEFTHGAKQRGIRVLIDLVVNHTSDQHPWFQEARRDPNSKYRDWYVWSKKKPPHADEGMVFPGVQKSTWTLRRGGEGVVLPPLLRVPARPQHLEPGGAGRDPQDHGLLDPARRVRLPHGRGAVHHRAPRAPR